MKTDAKAYYYSFYKFVKISVTRMIGNRRLVLLVL